MESFKTIKSSIGELCTTEIILTSIEIFITPSVQIRCLTQSPDNETFYSETKNMTVILSYGKCLFYKLTFLYMYYGMILMF